MLYYILFTTHTLTIPGNRVFTTAQSRPGVSFSLILVPTPLRYSNSLAWGTLHPHPLNYVINQSPQPLPLYSLLNKNPLGDHDLWGPKGRTFFSTKLDTNSNHYINKHRRFISVYHIVFRLRGRDQKPRRLDPSCFHFLILKYYHLFSHVI